MHIPTSFGSIETCPGLTQFLNYDWFSAVATLLKDGCLPSDQLEKLSILLQRLSTLRYKYTHNLNDHLIT